jgi:hypothetical protein
MAIEASGAFIGGALGLIGALCGVFLGHILSSSREHAARRIEGLNRVMIELNRRGRLGLQFDQLVNVGLRSLDPYHLASQVSEMDDWKVATHELQEQAWKFPCMAYLPDAYSEFEEIDRQIGIIMDPTRGHARSNAVSELVALLARVQIRVQEKLGRLV